MKYVAVCFLAVFMLLELILRVALVVVLVCSIIGIVLLIDGPNDFLDNYCYKLMREIIRS